MIIITAYIPSAAAAAADACIYYCVYIYIRPLHHVNPDHRFPLLFILFLLLSEPFPSTFITVLLYIHFLYMYNIIYKPYIIYYYYFSSYIHTVCRTPGSQYRLPAGRVHPVYYCHIATVDLQMPACTLVRTPEYRGHIRRTPPSHGRTFNWTRRWPLVNDFSSQINIITN